MVAEFLPSSCSLFQLGGRVYKSLVVQHHLNYILFTLREQLGNDSGGILVSVGAQPFGKGPFNVRPSVDI